MGETITRVGLFEGHPRCSACVSLAIHYIRKPEARATFPLDRIANPVRHRERNQDKTAITAGNITIALLVVGFRIVRPPTESALNRQI